MAAARKNGTSIAPASPRPFLQDWYRRTVTAMQNAASALRDRAVYRARKGRNCKNGTITAMPCNARTARFDVLLVKRSTNSRVTAIRMKPAKLLIT